MNVLKVGDTAPEFSCKNQHGISVNLSEMLGKKVVIFSIQKQILQVVLLRLAI